MYFKLYMTNINEYSYNLSPVQLILCENEDRLRQGQREVMFHQSPNVPP